MKLLATNIDTIIFDLGGVILNLDPQKTMEAFANITGLPTHQIVEHSQEPIFKQYEKGEISSAEFRSGLRDLFSVAVEDKEIDDAWNAMLLDLPLKRLTMLAALRPGLKTFVLSNTNEIHIKSFDAIVSEATKGNKIQDFFDTVYYSHKVGMRKPDAKIFEMVVDTHKLRVANTLFIDDTLEHIESAKKIGLQTWHLTNQKELFKIFKNG